MNVHRTRYCTLWLLVLLTTLSCAGGGDQWLSGPTPPPPSTVLLAAGDIGVCGSTPAIETGLMLDSLDGTILAVGDLAYRHGTAEEFATQCGIVRQPENEATSMSSSIAPSRLPTN